MFKSVGIEPVNLADRVLQTIPESYYAISDWFCDNNNDLWIPSIPGTVQKLTFSRLEGLDQCVCFNVGSCVLLCKEKIAGVIRNSITNENSKTQSVHYQAKESMFRDDFEIVVQVTDENMVELKLSCLGNIQEIEQSLVSRIMNKKYLVEVANWSTLTPLNDKQASFILAEILQARSSNKSSEEIIKCAEASLSECLSSHKISL